MKVKEAKTKICPFIIDFAKAGDVSVGEPSKCICGGCMAWQYTEALEFKAMGTLQNKVIVADHETEYGYCKRIENGK